MDRFYQPGESAIIAHRQRTRQLIRRARTYIYVWPGPNTAGSLLPTMLERKKRKVDR
jgi:hypothetical protein